MAETRAEFIRGYAARSGLSADYAEIGLLDIGSRTRIALPCGCREKDCRGWAMVSADNVDSHLRFSAPTRLRNAYIAATKSEES